MDENARVDGFDLGGGSGLTLLLKLLEIIVNLREFNLIEARIKALGLKNRNDRLGRRLGREGTHRGNRAIDATGARLGSCHVHRARHSARHVGVYLDRHLGHGLYEGRDEFARRAGRKNTRHVLDGERVDAHRLLLFSELYVILNRVDGRCRIADRTLGMTAVFLDARDGDLEVARIVERIEHAENIHSVLAGERDKALYDIVGIMLVAENVLTAKKHLQGRLGARLLYPAQSLPRILAQKAHADVERRAAPAFKRVKARVVDLGSDFKNIVGTHACSPKRLMGVAQCRVGNTDFLSRNFFHNVIISHFNLKLHLNLL